MSLPSSMARKNESPQKTAMREMMRSYLKDNDISIKSGTDVNSVMRDMMSVLLEGALDEELDEELGYSKCDYRNKDTHNSRNGHSKKTMHTSYGDMDMAMQSFLYICEYLGVTPQKFFDEGNPDPQALKEFIAEAKNWIPGQWVISSAL